MNLTFRTSRAATDTHAGCYRCIAPIGEWTHRLWCFPIRCSIGGLLILMLSVGSIVAEDLGRHWSFVPLKPVLPPVIANPQAARNEIDAFILQSLESKGLALAQEADRYSLVRRVYFDLIGLPPSPDEIHAFVSDDSPRAYETLLDRLMESPHFGERWGRHWLDNAGYVDVQGLDNDAGIISTTENKWLYRDYVIQSFNADKPFDRFLVEQLAGDECADWRTAEQFTSEIQSLLIATGFLRNSADDTSANELNRRDVHHQILERTHEVVINNLLGLTLQCAKCHDHKYEPIPQADYYRWQAFFQPAFNPDKWLQPAMRQIPGVSPTEKKRIDDHNSQIEQQVADLRGQIEAIRKPFEQQLFDTKLLTVPEPIRTDTSSAVRAKSDQRNEIQKYLAAKFEQLLKIDPKELTDALPQEARNSIADLEKQIPALLSQKKTFPHWQVVYDAGPPTDTHILNRGDPLTPGDLVGPGMLSALAVPSNSESEIIPQFGSSGRRRTLANWLSSPQTPAGSLLVRVRVNRIWQHLFGRGIVKTTDNFGVTGSRPSHPELLEWLGNAFVTDGQRLKPFLKRIMSSSAYRQSSARNDSHCELIDPDNTLLWKQRVRRLESEAVRDAILTVSGKLDRSMGGAPVPVEPRPDGSFVVKSDGLATPTANLRRTIYLLARRNYHPTLLSVFDQPNLATNCSERSTSAVVLQSLTMLNDAFVLEQAASLAERVQQTAKKEQWLAIAFELTLGRPPLVTETQSCSAALAREVEYYQQAEPSLPVADAEKRALIRICHTLLNTSEFLVVP
jgi:hypothetical protein